MIVVDASVFLEVILGTDAGHAITDQLLTESEDIHAPHLVDLEVAQVLRRYVISGDLTSERGRLALQDLADFPITRYQHVMFLPRIWALHQNLSAYDAAYIALAESLEVPLLTRDTRLSRSPGLECEIQLA